MEKHLCEICSQRDGEHNADFDGYACEECKSQWTERVEDEE